MDACAELLCTPPSTKEMIPKKSPSLTCAIVCCCSALTCLSILIVPCATMKSAASASPSRRPAARSRTSALGDGRELLEACLSRPARSETCLRTRRYPRLPLLCLGLRGHVKLRAVSDDSPCCQNRAAPRAGLHAGGRRVRCRRDRGRRPAERSGAGMGDRTVIASGGAPAAIAPTPRRCRRAVRLRLGPDTA